ncbi:MAG: molybdopterin molybdotransferase MoeA [Armatimonadetes bacterium]|nr:molybdopterin molybdotransferase MoeA [Armatimonadota bacterium]
MIKVEEAKNLILKEVKTLDIEEIHILESLKRISAQDIYSPLDIPHFDNSAVDGYALKSEDTKGAESNPKILNIIDEIPAGIIPKKSIKSGEVMRIFTGAIIPKGANAVIMQENTEKLNHEVKIFKELINRENIRFRGEDLKKGNLILEKNTPLRASSIGILASIGISKIKIFKKPIVSILATGDELIEIEEKLILGKVRNSNTYSLASQIKQSGGIPLILGIAKDKEKDICWRL